MENYRLWYVRRGEQVQGPFPEALICRYIVLGRIVQNDALSLDSHYWRQLHELPELVDATRALIDVTESASADDVDWKEERTKAALRWLDDRKSPDPRSKEGRAVIAEAQNRRTQVDRRQAPETVEHHVYRENRAMFESWNRMRKQRYGWAVSFVVLAALLVLGAALFMQPVRPVKVGLHIIRPADCSLPAARKVNWSGCNKEGELLVGADLRGAELLGTRLKGALLTYADLTQANLGQADLTDADLKGARLGNAVWTDGRVCSADSIGICK